MKTKAAVPSAERGLEGQAGAGSPKPPLAWKTGAVKVHPVLQRRSQGQKDQTGFLSCLDPGPLSLCTCHPCLFLVPRPESWPSEPMHLPPLPIFGPQARTPAL